MSTSIDGKVIMVTGANRGIGQALVTEALRRGAARVYAGTGQPYAHPDLRVDRCRGGRRGRCLLDRTARRDQP
jgi:NAD(P)-dependent dehydrogenase (short-subunit alcohol dehydrogenase family)